MTPSFSTSASTPSPAAVGAPPSVETLSIDANGLRFHALAAGPADGPLLILLHGFPETSHGWTKQIGPLADAGFRVVAPDQRGVGRSSKPAGVGQYRIDLLAEDVVAIIRALGRDDARIVGHDGGGVVTWHLLEHHADRVRRAVILDAPPPAVFPAYLRRHPSQLGRSGYMAFFQLPWLPESLAGEERFRRAGVR